jgi:hypothetical protein
MVAIESVDGTYRARRGSRVVQVALYKCMYYYKTSYIRTFFCHAAKVSVRAKRHTSTVYAQCARSTLSAFCGYVRERLAREGLAEHDLKKKTRLFVSLENCLYLTPRSRALSLNRGPSVSRLASSSSVSRKSTVFQKTKRQNVKTRVVRRRPARRSSPARAR